MLLKKHIVCLTFDFDALSIWIARGMVSPTALSRGEFGVVGATRILALLRKYNIVSTWFVPGHTIESFPASCEQIVAAGHEIGNHGWTHRSILDMSQAEEEDELLRASESIRKLTGHYPIGYRSPVWDLTPNTVHLLIKHGFYYESNLMANDYSPYRTRSGDKTELLQPAVFGKPTRLIEIPVSWSLDDAPHFELLRTPNWVQPGLSSAHAVFDNWLDDFRYMTQATDWGVLTYTCHPYCIGRGHRLMMLERLIVELIENGAAFMSLSAVAEEFDARSPYSPNSKSTLGSNKGEIR